MEQQQERKLPRGWVETKVRDLSELLRGVSYKKPCAEKENIKGYIPILRANNITDQINYDDLIYIPEVLIKAKQYLVQGDIVIAMSSGSKNLVGKAAQLIDKRKASFGAFCGVIRPSLKVLPEYLGCFFQSKKYRDHVSSASLGSNINNLKREHVLDLNIPLPPLNEQKRIAAKIEALFSELDRGTEKLEQIETQLRQLRQTVLKAAMTGELTKDWRRANQAQLEPADKLLKRILKKRREEWKGNGKYKEPQAPDTNHLPELPDGWVWATVGALSYNIQYGYTASSITSPVGPKILRITDIQDNKVDWETLPYCKISKNELGKYSIKKDDLFFARTGATVGKSYLLQKNILNTIFASYLIRVQYIKGAQPQYIYYYFQSQWYWNQIYQNQSGTGQPNFNGEKLGAMISPLPPITEQKEIVQCLEKIFSKISTLENYCKTELQRKSKLRQAILKAAFAGQLVPQDPKDEPASKLLKRIQTERANSQPVLKPAKKHRAKRAKSKRGKKREIA